MRGYSEGLERVREELGNEALRGDVNYWRDSIRWLGKASNVVKERSFCLIAIQIMHQTYQNLGVLIKIEIIKSLTLMKVAETDVEILEKILWLLAEVTRTEDCTMTCLIIFLHRVTLRIAMLGELKSCARFEILPALLRICSRSSVQFRNDFRSLVEMILFSNDLAPGKVLWTLADTLLEMVAFTEEPEEWTRICTRLSNVLIQTPSIKAKQHIAKVCNEIINLNDCPSNLKGIILRNLEICNNWIERVEKPDDIDCELFVKYCESLRYELRRGWCCHPD